MLADLILGHEPIIAVEWDKYACRVLRERASDGWFPDLRVWEGDVRLFDPSEYTGVVDCIHAGFPCQDISVAGKQAGVHEGTRSGLYREVLRIAGIVRPRYLFLENVAAILSNGLGTVLADLVEMGYDCRWLCIRASDVGAPHHRDRWFLLANSNNSRNNRLNGFRYNGIRPTKGEERGRVERFESGQESTDMAYSRSTRIHERWRPDGFGEDVRISGGNERHGLPGFAEEESEVLADADSAPCKGNECAKRSEQKRTDHSESGWWTTESDVGRVAHGISDRVGQLKGYGNAQVPLQAAVAYRLLGGI